ncbi:MAG TPA: 3-phosphoshikimate 1-carboxyvinyltransferase [Chloroflexota bacterium]|nr:3-phosphoshikimate 1-carboxyvinyltransferase [Chloroflexota bacterium]
MIATSASSRVVSPARSLRGEISVPGDKSISHRAILHNAIASGDARVENLGLGDDVRSSIASVRMLGVAVTETGPNACIVHGHGPRGLHEPDDVLDVGNSGTTTRLLAGILAGQPFLSVVTGDASLRARPMDRIIDPLRMMGATALGRQDDDFLPMAIRGGDLRAIDYALPVASAQVKSCLLLAGSFADGETHIREPAASRDHTERLLAAQGAAIHVDGGDIAIRGGHPLRAVDVVVPGDTSAAAFWVVAACVHPDAEITVRNVGVSAGRTGFLDVLAMMGADVRVTNRRVAGGEPVADIVACSSQLRGVTVGGDLIPRLIDEAPILAVAACMASGDTVISDATELRYKESDRIAVVAAELGRLGAEIEERPDGMVVHGAGSLEGGSADSRRDHRMAMALAVAGLVARNPVAVLQPESVTVSYPAFWDDLQRLAHGPEGA